ncbi:MAG: UDP-phosphate galactose phosphotransferase [Proteobacteria bacterium]|nr:MAG: UDP-phosphate galactose phosphotransferase [Pseudomonadota bacterium]
MNLHLKKTISFLILFFLDALLLWLSISCIYLIRLHGSDYFVEPMLQSMEFYNQLPIYYMVVLGFLLKEGIYHKHFDFWEEVKRIYKGLIIGVLSVFTYLALTKQAEEFSRFVIFGVFLILLFTFPILKRFIKFILVKFDLWVKPVKVVGNSKEAVDILDEFDKNWYLGMRAVPFASTVVIAIKGHSRKELIEISEKYMLSSKEVLFVPVLSHVNFADSNIVEFHNPRLSLIEVKNKLKEPFAIFVKVCFDFSISLLLLPILFLVLVIIIFLMKFDSRGKVFFKQKRLGKNSKVFNCYKFRTMYENSQSLLENYLKNNPDEIIHYNIYHKYKNDPRITPLGKWLRKTSLDELPQIINVAFGQMSLIGPRPYMVEEKHKLGKSKEDILLVKPGITGLWQISGRNEISFSQRVDLDKWYIRNWNLWLDLIILIKTFKVVLLKTGAK